MLHSARNTSSLLRCGSALYAAVVVILLLQGFFASLELLPLCDRWLVLHGLLRHAVTYLNFARNTSSLILCCRSHLAVAGLLCQP
jgi:hypothetical protein